MNQLRAGGFGDDEISAWQSQQTQKLQEGGFAQPEIDDYFGVKKHDPTQMKRVVADNHAAAQAAKAPREPVDTSIKPVEAQTWEDAIAAGWQMSITSLGLHGKPDVILPENASMAAQIIASLPQLAGDAPAIAAGMMMGTAAGAAAGTAVAPGVGTALGAAAGANAGAFAVPAAIRKLYMDHYEKGDIKDSADFAARMGAATWEAIKGGATGLVTFGAGRFAGPVVKGVAGATAGKIAATASEIAAMTTASAALEGHLPKLQDFAVGAVTVGGLHALGAAMPGGKNTGTKMNEIFRQTGETPAEVAQAAATDPVLKQELVVDHADVTGISDAGPEVGPKNFTPEQQVKIDKLDSEIHRLGSSEPTDENVEKHINLINERDEFIDQVIKENAAAEKSPGETPPNAPQNAANGPPLNETGGPPADGPPPSETPAKSLSGDERAILSRIGEDAERPTKTALEKYREFRTNNIDANEPLATAGAQKTYEMARRYNAVADKVKGFFEDGTRDFKTQDKNGEGLISIFQDNETTNSDPGNRGLLAYMMAKRGLELDSRGIESLFDSKSTADAAKRVVAEGADKYEAHAKRINDFENRILDYWAASGMMTPEMVAKVKELNQAHLPLQTIQEIDTLTGQRAGRTSGKIHKVLGSLALKQDPIESLFRNTEALIKRAEVNRVRQSFVTEMGPELENFLRPVEPEMTNTRVETKELGSALGIDPDLLERGLDVWRREQPQNGEGRIEVYEDGERKIYEGRPDIIDTLSRLDGDFVAMGTLSKVARGFSNALRIGSVENPAFAFTHFWRSQRAAGTYSKTGMIPFWHPLMSLPDFFNKPEIYREFLNDGGAVSSIDRISSDYLEGKVFKGTKNAAGEYEFRPDTMFEKTWNTIKRGPHMFGEFISLTDNMARYTEYKRAREQGMSREDAAFQGRNVTADYQRRGAKTSAIRTATAFLNVHTQVTDRALMEMSGPDRNAFFLKCLAAYTVPHLLLWAAGYGDSRVEEQQDFQRVNSMSIPIDWWRPPAPGIDVSAVPDDLKRQRSDGTWEVNDGPVMHVPVAGVPEVVFGTMVTASLESLRKKNPRLAESAVEHIFKDIGGTIVPIPTMAAAPLEHYMNKSIYTGNKVVPNSKLALLPQDQYDPYSTEVAKQIAKGVGYIPGLRELGPGNMTLESPMVIDNYIRSWTGAGGKMAVDIADSALHKAGIGEDRVEPEKEWTELPGLRRFFMQFPNSRPQSITDFDENYMKAQQIHNSMRDSLKRGNIDRVEDIQRSYSEGEMTRLKGIAQALSKAGSLIRTVRADNENYSPNDKKQLITTTYYQMLQMARMGNEIMKQVDKNAKDAKAGGN